jgi:SAM-dependent methyltransferase
MALARYDAVADFYISGFDSVDDPVSVALLGLLGPLAGQRVLDVACGHGRITRELARRGADVAGIDISGNLIRKARETEQDEPLGIRYLHADVTTPEPITGCCRPARPRFASTNCGSIRSPSRFRNQIGTTPMMLTVSRCFSWPGRSS